MPEYSRPNLSIPSTLWGEVKVSAFRRGVRPVDVVVECLREKFTEPPREARKQAKVESKPAEPPSVLLNAQATFVEPLPVLKDGFGWCRVCRVEQVKLPGMLCKKCSKL